MKLSTRARYGVRLMTELACKTGDKPVHLSQIAKSQNLSDKYLEQIISPLKASELVRSIRGSKGGYLLAKKPAEIKVLDIIESLEGPLNIVDCTNDEKCNRDENCAAQKLWKMLSNNIKDFLKDITLEDLQKWNTEGNKNIDYVI